MLYVHMYIRDGSLTWAKGAGRALVNINHRNSKFKNCQVEYVLYLAREVCFNQ